MTELFGNNDFIFMHDGEMLRTHHPSRCVGNYCNVHNPSSHPLRDAPLHWRSERYLMERVCSHGIGHPDPDDIAFKKRCMPPDVYASHAFGVHGCDGCCRWPVKGKDDV